MRISPALQLNVVALVWSTIGLLATGLASPSATADIIYRCDAPDGSIIFSDQPCGQSQRQYEPSQRLSIVGAPPDLIARMTENQAFIDQRRARIRAQEPLYPGHTRPQSPEREPSPNPYLMFFPVWTAPSPLPPGQGDHGSAEPSRAQDKFSALSGPFPGTVRRTKDQ